MNRLWKLLFSDDIRDFEGYSIGKTLKYMNDPDIISFAVGMTSPDTFPKDFVRKASQKILQDNIDRVLQYSPIPGESALIEEVIKFLKRDNVNVKEENILITSSGQHGLDLTGRLFINPGDSILIDRPTFGGALVAFQMERPNYLGVNIQKDGSDIEGFRKKIEESKRNTDHPLKFIYVVPDFQNPTGITMSLEKREALLDLSYEFNIPIVEDSPYRTLRYCGKSIPSLFSLDQKRNGENVISLFTFSKIFAPGIRIGFNIGEASIIEKMTNIKEANVLNSPKWNQDICALFLKEMNLDSYFRMAQEYYRNKLEKILEILSLHLGPIPGVTWTEPEGGLFLWITVPEYIDTMELFYEAIREDKVAFVPGEAFYAENPEKNHIRINFSYLPEDQFEEGIKRLTNCLKRHLR